MIRWIKRNRGSRASSLTRGLVRPLTILSLVSFLVLAFPFQSASGQLGPRVASAQVQDQLTVGCPSGGAPDVALDVPQLSLDELIIVIEELEARINLEAQADDLVTIHAGVRLSAKKITIEIRGIDVELTLTVCLGRIVQIVDRVMTTIDRNPQILTDLVNNVSGLLNQTVNQLGQTVTRTVDQAGNILESTLDSRGSILSQQTIGNISDLPLLSEVTNSAGQIVRQYQDESGSIIEAVYDRAGNLLSTQVLRQGSQ